MNNTMTNQKTTSKALNVSLWVAQLILASMFLMSGIMKSTQSVEELATTLPWVNDVSIGLVRFIGVSELLGAIGVLFPALFRIKPILTPLAALGIAIIMILAFIFHLSRGEYEALGFNLILGGLAFFVAWGRYKKAPIKVK